MKKSPAILLSCLLLYSCTSVTVNDISDYLSGDTAKNNSGNLNMAPSVTPSSEVLIQQNTAKLTIKAPVIQEEPKYEVKFTYTGKFPDKLTGNANIEPTDMFVNVKSENWMISSQNRIIKYKFAESAWLNASGSIKTDAPKSLPLKWIIKVYHMDSNDKKYGSPLATAETSSEFSDVTWNGVTSDGKLAPDGKYTMEFIPDGFKAKPVSNFWALNNFPPPAADAPKPDYLPDQLLVKFKNTDLARGKYNITSTNSEGWSVVKIAPGMTVSSDDDNNKISRALNELATKISMDENALSAEPNILFQASYLPNDTLISQQYALTKVNAFDGWNITKGVNNVIIAVVDTGIDSTHPDLSNKTVPGFNLIDNNTNTKDDHGHGTHVSGIAAGIGDNNEGIAGLAMNCKIMPVKVLNASGQGSTLSVANGVKWAADNGAKVINMSLGSTMGSSALLDAIRYAVSKNVTIVVAMGNDGGNVKSYPAYYVNDEKSIVTVGSTDSNDERSYFSNYGSWITVAAPGTAILSTLPGYSVAMNSTGNKYGEASGTSMATPYVAGLAGLVISQDTSLTPAQVKQIIQNGTDDLGTAGFDQYFGYGRINAWKTLNGMLAQPLPTPSPTVTPSPTATPQSNPTSRPVNKGYGSLLLDIS